MGSDAIVVRLARSGDAGHLVAVYDALGYPATAEQIARRLRRLPGDGSYRTWVAEVEGRVVGLAGATVGPGYEHDAPHVHLLALAVSAPAQGSGAGSALLAAVEAWGRRRGASRVVLHSGRPRRGAHAFYQARGYADTGVRFVKELDPPAGS